MFLAPHLAFPTKGNVKILEKELKVDFSGGIVVRKIHTKL